MDALQHCLLLTAEHLAPRYLASAENVISIFLRKTNINFNFVPEIRVCVEIADAYIIHLVGSAVNENQVYRIIANLVPHVK